VSADEPTHRRRRFWRRRGSGGRRVNTACIGVGGMGARDLESVQDQNIVALCDVDESALDKQAEAFPDARRYVDFRKMLEEMDKEIEAVIVSTPDHTHFFAAMLAMQMGKHVFVQKPLTHDVWEARTLTEAAARFKVCTQMGNQGTASSEFRQAVEIIRSGAIGPVREVHVWTDRPTWPQGTAAVLGIPGVQSALEQGRDGSDLPPVPPNLHWDLWLGTAPARPYHPRVYQPRNWRAWWDFGTGALGDMACHTANLAFMACRLGHPTSVEAEVSEYNPETCPTWSIIRSEFPARGELPPLRLTWYDGGHDKPAWVNARLADLAQRKRLPASGSLLIGDKGMLFSPGDYGEAYRLLPEDGFEDYEPPAPTLPRCRDHHDEWLASIRDNKPEQAMSRFSYAGPLTEAVLLGCVAIRARRKILWDGPNLMITDDAEANKYLKRQYRAGWTL
jgi:predicted dehydrogenase